MIGIMNLVKITVVLFVSIAVGLSGCNYNKKVDLVDSDTSITNYSIKTYNYVKIDNGLKFIFPDFSKVDLECGDMPSINENSVILVAEAAYTGECLNEFKHTNIAGDHVSGGKRYSGYRCSRNTGAFVYYNDRWKFCYKNYSHELDSAAMYGGTAFAQELIIKDKKLLETPRKDSSKNIFRALCELSDNLCIVEADSIITFGDFKTKLVEAQVENAIYLDMGSGWNHAWYRTSDSIVELHPKTHNYCTNWITFYGK